MEIKDDATILTMSFELKKALQMTTGTLNIDTLRKVTRDLNDSNVICLNEIKECLNEIKELEEYLKELEGLDYV